MQLLGVFDTVGALGVPGAWSKRHQFHDVNLSKAVRCARQALAIDEQRQKFEPCLWEADEETRLADEASGRVEQVWFEGVHSDVGGGYAETGLCDTALLWMAAEANRRGLVFDTRLLATYTGSGSSVVRHQSLNRFYRFLNLLSRGRMRLTRKGRRFAGSWRRLDPLPTPGTDEQRAVGVRIASSASRHFDEDEAYGGRNLVEYADQTRGFEGVVADVLALPEPVGAVDTWLREHGLDLGAPPHRWHRPRRLDRCSGPSSTWREVPSSRPSRPCCWSSPAVPFGATAAPAKHSGHRLPAVRVASPDHAPAAVPHSHRAQHLQRLDGSGPALLPDRAGSPRPSYTAARTGRRTERPVVRSHGTAHGRAPPA